MCRVHDWVRACDDCMVNIVYMRGANRCCMCDEFPVYDKVRVDTTCMVSIAYMRGCLHMMHVW